ncbi:AAA family ATPase [Streptomyces sp. NPDC087420]|uniref:AAA family ATPase n=1 Tax=Streptomyces sp. NPDC087420 TaxID=3365785 RepID=UPI00383336C9
MLKYLGLDAGGAITITAQQIITACEYLFGVSGHPLYGWFDPITQGWQTNQANGGWPVGTVWTQILRPSQGMRDLISVKAERGSATVSLTNNYLNALGSQLSGQALPERQMAIWLARNREDLEPGPVDVAALIREMKAQLRLDKAEAGLLLQDFLVEYDAVDAVGHWSGATLAALLPSPPLQPAELISIPATESLTAEEEPDSEGYAWTEEFARVGLPDHDVRALVERLSKLVAAADLVLPDADNLLERCVIGLLTGHVILQGPPGTAKTRLARILARAFQATSTMRTATADWTTYEVIGGLRPMRDSTLAPTLGYVTEAALDCARVVRAAGENGQQQGLDDEVNQRGIASWLILDELNRADIDRAIGGLYTTLSSTDSADLASTPVDLSFEEDPDRKRLWFPGRFRIIGTMNDVDTSYVNSLSQGLSRRFQFIYVGVPEEDQVKAEVSLCRKQAQDWLSNQYEVPSLSPLEGADQEGEGGAVAYVALAEKFETIETQIRELITWLRYEKTNEGEPLCGWPLGSAQVRDLWKAVLLRGSGADSTVKSLIRTLDVCFADRIVPQMGNLRSTHVAAFASHLKEQYPDLEETLRAVKHLSNTQSVR